MVSSNDIPAHWPSRGCGLRRRRRSPVERSKCSLDAGQQTTLRWVRHDDVSAANEGLFFSEQHQGFRPSRVPVQHDRYATVREEGAADARVRACDRVGRQGQLRGCERSTDFRGRLRLYRALPALSLGVITPGQACGDRDTDDDRAGDAHCHILTCRDVLSYASSRSGDTPAHWPRRAVGVTEVVCVIESAEAARGCRRAACGVTSLHVRVP
jgi:hypothetical protein